MNSPRVCDHWIDHPDGRLFAREWTPLGTTVNAVPIVMLHDSLGCVALWRDFPAAVCTALSRRVIAYDRLGFGRSDARRELPALGFVAEEAVTSIPALREQLGIDRLVVLGHSVGGGMAIETAAQRPEVCEALITVAAQVFTEARTLQGIRAAKEQFKDPKQIERLAKYHGAKTRWVLDAWIDNWLDPKFAAWSLETVLPRVACPTLAIHGELDEYGSAIHPTLIGRLCGGATRVELLDGIGHVPQREAPERVGQLLATFFAALPKRLA